MIYLENSNYIQNVYIPRTEYVDNIEIECASKIDLQNAIKNEEIRADGKYATKGQLKELEEKIPSLEGYVTEDELKESEDNIKEWTKAQGFATETWVKQQEYLTKTDIENLVTEDELEEATENIKEWTKEQGYLTEHQSLEDYTKTKDFATINGQVITNGGNIEIEAGSPIKEKGDLLTDGTYEWYGADYVEGIENELENKQDKLISGSNIKTINGETILGEGNIEIEGGKGTEYKAGKNIDIDDENRINVVGINSYEGINKEDVVDALGYEPMTENEINGKIKAAKDEIEAEIPKNVSDLNNDAFYTNQTEVEGMVNDAVKKIQDNLDENYYDKSHTDLEIAEAIEGLEHATNDEFEKVEKNIADANEKITKVDAKVDATDEKVTATNSRIDATNSKVDETNTKLEETNAKVSGIDAKVNETSTKLEETNTKLEQTNANVSGIDAKVNETSTKLEETNKKVEDIDSQVEQLNGELDGKQDKLVSGVNIKTINGETLLGEGNVEIELGSDIQISESEGVVTIENEETFEIYSKDKSDELFATKEELAGKQDAGDYALKSDLPDMGEYTKTSEFATVNGQSITNGGNIEIEAGSPISDNDGVLTDGTYEWYDKSNTDLEIAEAIEGLEHSVNEELEKKQDNLVSGENIKTINGESILGSGNIEIKSEGGVTQEYVDGQLALKQDKLDINGDMMYASSLAPRLGGDNAIELYKKKFGNHDWIEVDVQYFKTINGQNTVGEGNIEITEGVPQEYVDEKLAEKQDVLVSGENIKTVNGVSVLGDGNVEIFEIDEASYLGAVLRTKKDNQTYFTWYDTTRINNFLSDINTRLDGINEAKPIYSDDKGIFQSDDYYSPSEEDAGYGLAIDVGEIPTKTYHFKKSKQNPECFIVKVPVTDNNSCILYFNHGDRNFFAQDDGSFKEGGIPHKISLPANQDVWVLVTIKDPNYTALDASTWKYSSTNVFSDKEIEYIAKFKTINGESVLGDGNIEITGGGGTGDVTKAYVDEQLATKQDKLSGNYVKSVEVGGGYIDFETYDFKGVLQKKDSVNFKTINGQSILGAGNIKIEGGSGGGTGGEQVIELTADEYSKLETYEDNTTYIITDAEPVDLNNFASQAAVNSLDSRKQETLVSGTNIKTINGNSILGDGDLYISQGNYYYAGNGLQLSNDGQTFSVIDYDKFVKTGRVDEIESVIARALVELNKKIEMK